MSHVEASAEPETVVDCDFTAVFDGERFRLELAYHRNQLSSEAGDLGGTDEFVRQILLYQGDENYWARFDADGNASCLVLNKHWASTVLDRPSLPGPHPVRLWTKTVWWLRQEFDGDFDLVQLGENGVLARAKRDEVMIDCYLLPPKPLRLARLAIRTRGSTLIQHNLTWSEFDGIAYVSRFAERRVQSNPEKLTKSRVIELTALDLNSEIAASEFEIASMGVRPGTEFRANAPVPTRYVFDGRRLVRLTQ